MRKAPQRKISTATLDITASRPIPDQAHTDCRKFSTVIHRHHHHTNNNNTKIGTAIPKPNTEETILKIYVVNDDEEECKRNHTKQRN
jgi:hypothetical protein